jgi:hypothetical protein
MTSLRMPLYGPCTAKKGSPFPVTIWSRSFGRSSANAGSEKKKPRRRPTKNRGFQLNEEEIMKQISELINLPKNEFDTLLSANLDLTQTPRQGLAMEQSLKDKVIALDDRVMYRLWTRMGEIYGHRWVSSYGTLKDGAYETWKKALSDITPEQIANGLSACLTRNEGWPPSLPEFRNLCVPPEPKLAHNSHRLKPLALPEPKDAKAKRMAFGLASVQAMRAQLRGGYINGGKNDQK